MGRGIYSALGRWPEAELVAALETLARLCAAIDRDDPDVDAIVPGSAAVLRVIRVFEARIGRPAGLAAERVSTPHGPAIELGNMRHAVFGKAHEDAAGEVARALVSVLEALGGIDVFWFTMD